MELANLPQQSEYDKEYHLQCTFLLSSYGLFAYLRGKFKASSIYGIIHNLIHADDTLVIDEDITILKQKVVCTYTFFNGIDQSVNIGKSKYMCLDSCNKNRLLQSIVINGQTVQYTKKEKYLGHYITDDNSLNNSILCDLEERASNIIVKLRNFINNNKYASMQVRIKVFQSCFCSAILSNCEIWGYCLPKKVFTLYNKGLKIALEVRSSTPTALIFLETKQPSVLAIIRKRQLQFWINLQKEKGSEMYNLITRVEQTKYIKHYRELERCYITPINAFKTLNNKFYNEIVESVKNCKPEQSKLNTYKNIYGDSLANRSISVGIANETRQKLVIKYIVSSHNLACETSKWQGNDKSCKQCNLPVWETLEHFIFDCDAFSDIRRRYDDFPSDLKCFFTWELSDEVLELLHEQRGK